MKLAHFDWSSPIEFREGSLNTLVIENTLYFRYTILQLIDQQEGLQNGYILSDGDEIYDFNKYVEIITDPLRLAFDSRNITTKINQTVQEECVHLGQDSTRLIQEINQFAGDISLRLDFDVKYQNLNDLSGVMKLLGFSIDSENMTPLERILEYMNIQTEFFRRKLFILVNFKQFFTLEEQQGLLKQIQYKKYNVLLLEHCCNLRISPDEQIRIIDADLCEI